MRRWRLEWLGVGGWVLAGGGGWWDRLLGFAMNGTGANGL